MKLRLLIDPHEPVHVRFVDFLKSSLIAGEEVQPIAISSFNPAQPSRCPGGPGEDSITILLTTPPASTWPSLPPAALLLVEREAKGYRPFAAACGMQAILRRSPSTRLALLQASSTDAAGEGWKQLMAVRVPTQRRWQSQQQRLLASAAEGLLWWLRQCEQQQRIVQLEACPQIPAQHLPLLPARRLQPWQRPFAVLMLIGSGLRDRLTNLFSIGPRHWQIAVGRISDQGHQLQFLHHLPPDARGWYADPHLVHDGGTSWLFCERLAADQQRGVIDLFAVDANGLRPYGTVIEEPFHLSFPRMFCHDGLWYATVESGENHDVRLYEATDFPWRWRLRRQLLVGAAWLDPILLPLEQGWGLLVNYSSSLPSQPRSMAGELQLFVAEDLLSSEFRPHPESPLMLDSLASRNGGLLTLEQQCHRVAQQTGFDGAYGVAVQLQRIEVIDRLHYRERSVSPPWLPGLKRQLRASHLHTLNNCGPWVAVDYRSR